MTTTAHEIETLLIDGDLTEKGARALAEHLAASTRFDATAADFAVFDDDAAAPCFDAVVTFADGSQLAIWHAPAGDLLVRDAFEAAQSMADAAAQWSGIGMDGLPC